MKRLVLGVIAFFTLSLHAQTALVVTEGAYYPKGFVHIGAMQLFYTNSANGVTFTWAGAPFKPQTITFGKWYYNAADTIGKCSGAQLFCVYDPNNGNHYGCITNTWLSPISYSGYSYLGWNSLYVAFNSSKYYNEAIYTNGQTEGYSMEFMQISGLGLLKCRIVFNYTSPNGTDVHCVPFRQ